MVKSLLEKDDIQIQQDEARPEQQRELTGFDSENIEIPKGYFRSPYFLGSMVSIGLSRMGEVGGFALADPILGDNFSSKFERYKQVLIRMIQVL